MPKLPTPDQIRERIEAIEDPDYRLAHMYQYLIAGRESEVVGEYAPKHEDAIQTQIDQEPAILFAVQTAKHKGKLRPCAVPLNPDYEPWTKEVYNYFQEQTGQVFTLGSREAHPLSLKRYLRKKSREAFKDMLWPMKNYVWSKPSGETVKVPERWRPASNHCIRKARTIDLRLYYHFDSLDLSAFGGWKNKSQDKNIPAALEHYLHLSIQEASLNFEMLRNVAQSYFFKLCKPRREVK